ncbi:SMC-Scp complex subunit ScpB [Halomonas sp. McH1-25]|uniref:SMC-Scp complex subunit ScpB n=2 Tax=Halomonas TaxID=2745 RepID=UPI001EF5F209|nr:MULTISPECIES: SMC-Scp complex subunit ScpB [unclassified Halomonas]MCG7600746.1 SMC-Scp complex subunit ScpB [Halomonas sp. McH1-25]MCP1341324.1 SMC-Scp complex subunit ScpB [Halomonas sp. FL8]
MASVRLDEILEAALLAAGEPLAVERLEGLFDDHERPQRRELRDALEALGNRLENSALELIETASGYQVRIRQRLSPWVSRLWDERPQRYSRALLETLALIAYRQPVTRGDIEEVRGVAVSSSIMRTLSERGWIRVVGHRDVPGRPAVYATTRQFLDDFGLKTLDALPPMHELKEFDLPESPFYEDDIDVQARQAGERQEHAESADVPDADAQSDDPGHDADAGQTESLQDSTAGTADDTTHAGTASARPELSFADLEARLAERARNQQPVDREGDEDGLAGAENSSDENTSES